MTDNDKYIFNVKTVQSGAFRVLIESLKEILTDTNIIFDKTGIKLIATDNSQVVLIHMKLNAEKFEYFYCEKKTTIGVNMMNMFKLIKAMTSNDTLSLFIEKDNPNRLGIKINNVEKNAQTVFKMNLLDISEDELTVPPAKFETELTLPSSDFQKIIRDMTNIGENIEIKSVGEALILNCEGDFANQETVLCQTQGGLSFSKSAGPELPIQGIFSLKYLALFTKCTNLCNLIHLYIKNDYPLVIRYDVANLGHIKLCLSPNSETD
jgi:proliferating cell nuclear antigen|tara:strand:- start:6 stop:800 length:795 start_codon:yes stop_codon:yes gene_type:complete